MCIARFTKTTRNNFIKLVLAVTCLTYGWLIVKKYFLPPPTFWHVRSRNDTIPLVHALSRDSKLIFLKNCTLLVSVCARNVQANLPLFRKNIENVTSLFADHRIFIGESDSSDRTITYLYQWAGTDHRVVIRTYGNLSRTVARRSDRIAYCRNDLLDQIRRTDLFRRSKHPFYMVADADTNTRLNVPNFLSNFDYSVTEWDAMTANQYEGYYDIWALRDDTVNYDCWHITRKFLPRLITFDRTVEVYVGVHQKPIPSNHSLIPVQSAFGGAAIYQTKYLNGCRYSGYESHNICEHVPFNLCVTRNGGKIFINPKFQID